IPLSQQITEVKTCSSGYQRSKTTVANTDIRWRYIVELQFRLICFPGKVGGLRQAGGWVVERFSHRAVNILLRRRKHSCQTVRKGVAQWRARQGRRAIKRVDVVVILQKCAVGNSSALACHRECRACRCDACNSSLNVSELKQLMILERQAVDVRDAVAVRNKVNAPSVRCGLMSLPVLKAGSSSIWPLLTCSSASSSWPY